MDNLDDRDYPWSMYSYVPPEKTIHDFKARRVERM